jgi:hypothetical protein
MSSCALGFRLEVVSSTQDLLDACAVRALAYGHHMPDMAAQLAQPDELDFAAGTTVFICRDKETGLATGTMRIQSSTCGPLLMERSLSLPDWIACDTRAEVTRLAVRVGADPLTRLSLWKASYQFCMANGLHWMAVGARNEALIRNYRRLGFVDVFANDQLMPLAHTAGLPHRIMAFDAGAALRRWRETGHPLYGFFIETEHAELAAAHSLQSQTMSLAPPSGWRRVALA